MLSVADLSASLAAHLRDTWQSQTHGSDERQTRGSDEIQTRGSKERLTRGREDKETRGTQVNKRNEKGGSIAGETSGKRTRGSNQSEQGGLGEEGAVGRAGRKRKKAERYGECAEGEGAGGDEGEVKGGAGQESEGSEEEDGEEGDEREGEAEGEEEEEEEEEKEEETDEEGWEEEEDEREAGKKAGKGAAAAAAAGGGAKRTKSARRADLRPEEPNQSHCITPTQFAARHKRLFATCAAWSPLMTLTWQVKQQRTNQEKGEKGKGKKGGRREGEEKQGEGKQWEGRQRDGKLGHASPATFSCLASGSQSGHISLWLHSSPSQPLPFALSPPLPSSPLPRPPPSPPHSPPPLRSPSNASPSSGSWALLRSLRAHPGRWITALTWLDDVACGCDDVAREEVERGTKRRGSSSPINNSSSDSGSRDGSVGLLLVSGASDGNLSLDSKSLAFRCLFVSPPPCPPSQLATPNGSPVTSLTVALLPSARPPVDSISTSGSATPPLHAASNDDNTAAAATATPAPVAAAATATPAPTAAPFAAEAPVVVGAGCASGQVAAWWLQWGERGGRGGQMESGAGAGRTNRESEKVVGKVGNGGKRKGIGGVGGCVMGGGWADAHAAAVTGVLVVVRGMGLAALYSCSQVMVFAPSDG
ncbi:unnamed protein product [Closterium sp. NIES-53]